MKYYVSYDGDDHVYAGTSLLRATNAFWFSVENHDWCPALEDEDGNVLIAWDNSSYDRPEDFSFVFGPEEDPNPEPGIDRVWEEQYRQYQNYKGL